MRRALAGLIALVVLAPVSAIPATVGQPPAAPDAVEAPPYEDQLLRLSEILGAVQFLRQLCGTDEGDTWRQQMEKLIESEAPDDDRRARLVDRFNRGYDSYKSVYLSCTPAATEASDRYLQEGAKLAGEITARYGK